MQFKDSPISVEIIALRCSKKEKEIRIFRLSIPKWIVAVLILAAAKVAL